jgi:hypothetical protein
MVTEALTAAAARSRFRASFFLWMTIVMAGFIFGGFGLSYWLPMARGMLAPLPPVVHVHGLFYFAWIVLLIAQALLVNVKNVQLHESVGTFGIFIASGVLILGSLITVLFARTQIANPAPDGNALMYLSVVAILGFGALFCLAIRNTRRPDRHRRLILFATINLLPPGINRLYMGAFGLTQLPLLATYLTMDALVFAMLVYDWRTLGKLSAASLTGAAFVSVPQLLYAPIADSAAFAGLIGALGDLARYR